MKTTASLWRRARLGAGAAGLALLLSGCFDTGDQGDITTPPSTPVSEPGDACPCTTPVDTPLSPSSNMQRDCAP
jgi:hypothetical protein